MAEQFPCRLPEKNDKVRRVTLKVSGGTIQRPIVKLEENDSDVEEELHDVDDGSDSVELITFAKKRGPRKSSKGTRRVQHNWTDEEINRLIVAVENHPTLWDVGSSDYKLPKLNVWQEVTDELEMGIDTAEAKSKWSCLRTTFKTILSKIRKSSDGAKLQPVVWKWFTHMLFLEANVRQSTTLDLTSAVPDQFFLDDLPVSLQSELDGNQPKRRRLPEKPEPSATSPVPSSVNSNSNAVASLPSTDRNSTFCDHILSELRALPDDRAFSLRRILTRAMWEFLDGEHEQIVT